MNFEEEYDHLHRNQKLLVKELLKRGISVTVLDSDAGIIRATYRDHEELILDRDSSIMPYSVSVLAGNKMLTKKYLKTVGISVPIGCSFNVTEDEFIKEAFKLFKGGVVLKPTFGSYGHDVYIDLRTEAELEHAIDQIKKHRGDHTEILLEEYFDAPEYRVFLTRDGEYAVLNREQAYVIGNGHNTIQELVEAETKKRNDRIKSALCPIIIDDESLRLMRNHNISLQDIPLENQKVTLRYNSNVATGGITTDFTDIVHPSVIANCLKVFKAFPGLPYAGVDYMCKNITEEQELDDYRIIEINTNPGANMHIMPGFGKPRNISQAIVDMMFPETKETLSQNWCNNEENIKRRSIK